MAADLHLHSNFSDGTYTPEEIAANASAHKLRAVALTDHDTVEGAERMAAACESRGIEFIAASELTSEHEDCELHLLGYFLDTTNQRLLTELEHFQRVRRERIVEIVERLQKLNLNIASEAVFAIAKCNSPGRPHVARALVQAGICTSVDNAFERYLKRHRPAWVPKFKMSALEAIELVHQAGGLAVLAHPGINRADDVIPALVEAGLDGIECFHTKHSTAISVHYLEIAEQHGLLATGGSDCHGMTKGKPLIGSVKVPYEYVVRMKARLRRKAAGAEAASVESTTVAPQA